MNSDFLNSLTSLTCSCTKPNWNYDCRILWSKWSIVWLWWSLLWTKHNF